MVFYNSYNFLINKISTLPSLSSKQQHKMLYDILKTYQN